MAAESVLVRAPGEGHWLAWLGHPVRYLALGAETGDRYALAVATVPAGGGAPPHRHPFHEGFYVLRGALTVTAGDRTVVLPAGGFAQVAGGTAHAVRNDGPDAAEVLVLVAPAGFDRFQQEAGTPVDGAAGPFPPTDPGHLRAAAPKYGIDLDPPPDAFRVAPRAVVRPPGEGPCVGVVGDVYRFLAVSGDTDRTYALWHATVFPGGGPPPHVHAREAEGFYVLAGAITFVADGRRVVAGPGTFLHLPAGSLHHFKNEGDRPAETLILVAPGGLEAMFTETGTPLAGPVDAAVPVTPAELARLLAVAPRYGVDIRVPADH